ncbi:MAG: hypothetical protein GWP63_10540 [Haliea sp.]|jgi:hypothetical protein|nr:hypothetical protein [Haliea sp.]
MSQYQTQSIPQEKFLLMAVNLLHKAFVEAPRTDAKNIYREISEGKAVHLTTVRMEDGSTSRFNLKLDHSEYRGKLNYGAFRASLATLIGNVTQALKDEREINVFNAQEDPGTMMFGITAVTLEDDTPNVMVLGAELGGGAGQAMLSLMYLDPSQFVDQAPESSGPPGTV